VKALTAGLREALQRAGFALASIEDADTALAKERIRYTSGIDRTAATALRDARVDAVLLASVDLHDTDLAPRVAMSARLVSTEAVPRVLWMDRVALAGDDAPGLFGVGLVTSLEEVERGVLSRLVASLRRGDPGRQCGGGRRFGPRRSYRSPLLDATDRAVVAVMPFVNATQRRDAGEVVALEVLRQLHATQAFALVEPGDVRRALLAFRIILDGGVSADTVATIVDQIGADIVVSGTVLEYAEAQSKTRGPKVQYEVYALDAATGEVVWSSNSYARGEDGVVAFGIGRVTTAAALSCRMAGRIAGAMAGDRPRDAASRSLAAMLAPDRRGRAVSAWGRRAK
jgi:hypothetical protein